MFAAIAAEKTNQKALTCCIIKITGPIGPVIFYQIISTEADTAI